MGKENHSSSVSSQKIDYSNKSNVPSNSSKNTSKRSLLT
jgi:hypothetical protein